MWIVTLLTTQYISKREYNIDHHLVNHPVYKETGIEH